MFLVPHKSLIITKGLFPFLNFEGNNIDFYSGQENHSDHLKINHQLNFKNDFGFRTNLHSQK